MIYIEKKPHATRKKIVEEPRVQPPHFVVRVLRKMKAGYWEDSKFEWVLKLQDVKPFKELILYRCKAQSELGAHRESLLFLSGKIKLHGRRKPTVPAKLRGHSQRVPTRRK